MADNGRGQGELEGDAMVKGDGNDGNPYLLYGPLYPG